MPIRMFSCYTLVARNTVPSISQFYQRNSNKQFAAVSLCFYRTISNYTQHGCDFIKHPCFFQCFVFYHFIYLISQGFPPIQEIKSSPHPSQLMKNLFLLEVLDHSVFHALQSQTIQKLSFKVNIQKLNGHSANYQPQSTANPQRLIGLWITNRYVRHMCILRNDVKIS